MAEIDLLTRPRLIILLRILKDSLSDFHKPALPAKFLREVMTEEVRTYFGHQMAGVERTTAINAQSGSVVLPMVGGTFKNCRT
jgi:hypothetical protein